MKTINLYKILPLLVISLLLAVGVSSCKKTDDHDHDDEHGHVHVNFANKMGSMALMYSHEHTLANGRKYTFERVQYYVSNISLKKDDGTYYDIDGQVELVSGPSGTFDLDDVPAGSYQGIKFTVGIADTAVNHSDPSTYAASSPLALQTPGMHWSWNSGYIFIAVEGSIDTSAAATGTRDYDFELHLGGDPNTVEVELSKSFEVGSSEHPSLALSFDVENYIENNIDLGTPSERSTHTMDNMPLAMKLKNNIVASFSVQ